MHTNRLVLIVSSLCTFSACNPAGDRVVTRHIESNSCDLLIVNVHVVDVLSADVEENRDVCIKGANIVAVTPHATAQFESLQSVSGRDRYLLPGLNDMHVHFRGGEESVEQNRDLLTLYFVHGITGVYDLGSDIADDLLAWREQIRSGKLIGPDLYLTGPKVDGPNPWFPGSLIVETPGDAETAMDRLGSLGVDGVKIMGGTLSTDAFWFVLDAANAHELETIAHLPPSVSAIESARRGLDAIAHVRAVAYDGATGADEIRQRLITGEITSLAALVEFTENIDRTILRRAIGKLDAEETALITTHYGTWLMAGGLPEKAADWERHDYKYTGPLIRDSVEAGFTRDRDFALAHQRRYQSMKLQTEWMLRQLAETDVLVMAGSDSGPGNSIPGRVLHRELALLVEAGLSPAYVLRTATYNPAVFLGKADYAGEVKKGRVANLLLLGANPLSDISNTLDIDAVVKSGRYLSRAEIDAMLDELESKYGSGMSLTEPRQ